MSNEPRDSGESEIEVIADYSCETGENPLWHPGEKRLYWCDIPAGRIFRYDPETGVHEQCYTGRPVGGFTIQRDGSLLLFMDRGSVQIWRDGRLTEVVPEIAVEVDSRFNDVIADPRGGVFCGTMSSNQGKGRLYRLDTDGSIRVVLEGIGCSNGLAFTPDRKGLYYTDSFAREIYRFDYKLEDGSISNQRVFAHFTEADGYPDGITVDAQGRLWCAFWDGNCVAAFGIDGELEKRIQIPARKVSSVTFGGDEFSDLYVTTAGGNQKGDEGKLAGVLFRLRGRARGLPEFQSKIGIQDK